ncbi:glutathione S-transferase [Aspergillus leporis]|uniref:Glutathione S-transferase n=1 Tax=Aspergillus leporis TaxID=41062 RepID=A0A5N5WKP7_9EURO|nr:glutathione S-transferase [Aspergillus leporis]
MTFKLYGYERNPRTKVIQIVAKAEGIELELHRVIPRQGIGKAEYEERFSISAGKIPGFEAIVTFLARYEHKTGLLGSGSLASECRVLMWMSWANQELLQTLARWFLFLIPSFTDPASYSYEAVAAGRAASLRLLDKLEDFLTGQKYLVGIEITLADIMVAIYVSRGLEWVLDAGWRSQHPAIMGHFNLVARWDPVRAVVPQFILIDKETPNRPPRGREDFAKS